MIGASSTLLNAGDTTNFIFKVDGFSGDKNEVNSIGSRSKIRDRLKRIREMGGDFTFVKVKNPVFSTNLKKIDTIFPKIIANMLLDFFSGKGNTVSDLTKLLAANAQFSEF